METLREPTPQGDNLLDRRVAFGLSERRRVTRMLRRDKINSWVGGAVVLLLAATAVIVLSDLDAPPGGTPASQGLRK